MYAVVISVNIPEDRDEEAAELFANQVLPRVKATPGFVSGTWIRWLPESNGSTDMSIHLYESRECAEEAAKRAQAQQAGSPVTVVSVEVGAVSAQA
jgi:hypothetical protein